MLDPAINVGAFTITMRPVDDPASLIPFTFSVELDGVPDLDRSDTTGQIDIVSNEYRLSG